MYMTATLSISLLAAVGLHRSAPRVRRPYGWARAAGFLLLSCLACSVVLDRQFIHSCHRCEARWAAAPRSVKVLYLLILHHQQDRQRVRQHLSLAAHVHTLLHKSHSDTDSQDNLRQGSD